MICLPITSVELKDIINIYFLIERDHLQFLGQFLEGRLLTLIDHNLHHLFADQLLLGVLGIASCSHLLTGSSCEPNAEHS